jgi:SET domain-containing protein
MPPSRPPSSSRPAWTHWVRLSASAIHGRGVHARRLIPQGERVIEYVGERIGKIESRRREERRRARLARGGDGGVYIFDISRRYDIDGTSRRNVARWINHSCAPNCAIEVIRGRIWIVARRDIPAGEELSYDYGFPLREWQDHPCRCGSPRCPGYIVESAQRWRVRGKNPKRQKSKIPNKPQTPAAKRR